jgi:hypothetical protein
MGAGKKRQERRVGIDDAAAIGRDHRGPKNSHKSGRDDEVRRIRRKRIKKPLIPRCPVGEI